MDLNASWIVGSIIVAIAVWFIKRSISMGAEQTSKSITSLGEVVSELKTEVAGVKIDTQKIEIHLATMNGRIGTVESNMESHKELDEKLREGTHGRIKQIEESIKTLRQQA